MLFKLAWRNIWRNKRRTLITAAAVAFAVFFASVMRSFQKGVWDKAMDNAINLYYGAGQIHGAGYSDEQTLEYAIPFDQKINQLDKEIEGLDAIIPRIESFALASEGNLTRGVLVMGIDPEREDALTGWSKRIVEGEYLDLGKSSVIVGATLSEKLGLSLGDTLVLISQGYHGVNAAGKYPITGILKLPLPNIDKAIVCLPLDIAQDFYGAEGLITTLALKVDDRKKLPQTINTIRDKLGTELYEVQSWEALMPSALEARALNDAGSLIIFSILYFIIGFAILGTILMMTKERSYEFGVLTSIGMGRWKLFSTVWVELVMVGLLGAVLGILLSLGPVYYFHVNPVDMARFGSEYAATYEKFGMEPILPFVWEFQIFFTQALIIFCMTCILSLYPFFKIFNLKPVEAMRD